MRELFLVVAALGLFYGVESALAENWQYRTQNRGGQTQYYYVYPAQTQQQYRTQTNGGCVHGPNGSQCQHRYDVNRQYSVTQGNTNVASGTINYSGGRQNNYSHTGTSSEIANVDSIERGLSGLNRNRAELLAEVAKMKAKVEEGQALYSIHANTFGFSQQQKQEMKGVYDALRNAANAFAHCAQTDNDQTLVANLKNGVQWWGYAAQLESTYIDRYELFTPTYQAKRQQLIEARLAAALIDLLLK